MRRLCLLLCAALGAPLTFADTAPPQSAADGDAPVPPLTYRSVFADAFVAKEPQQAPDKRWVQANRTVAGDSPASQPEAAEHAPVAGTQPGVATPPKKMHQKDG